MALLQSRRAANAMARFTRQFYTDGAGAVRVESVLVEGLSHGFPIRIGSDGFCGRPGNFIIAADVCATTEIVHFWGLRIDH